MRDFLVSVLFITYNHEAYIRKALDSVLSQETDFPFEIVVGEDCSTDGTRDILRQYKEKYPDKFRLLFRKTLEDLQEMFMRLGRHVRGNMWRF